MARTPFKLKSGNSSSFKMMGGSPVKQEPELTTLEVGVAADPGEKPDAAGKEPRQVSKNPERKERRGKEAEERAKGDALRSRERRSRVPTRSPEELQPKAKTPVDAWQGTVDTKRKEGMGYTSGVKDGKTGVTFDDGTWLPD